MIKTSSTFSRNFRTTYLFTTLLTTTGLGVLSSSPCPSPDLCPSTSSSFTSERCVRTLSSTPSPSPSRSFIYRPTESTSPDRSEVTTMSAANEYGGGDGVSVKSAKTASALVIFLHGLGDSGHGWSGAFPFPNVPHVRYVLPHANNLPVTLNGGMRMPSWFDLYGLDESVPDDEAGIIAAVERVERIVDASNVPTERIVLAGFSQGGAVALTAALRSKKKFAGVVALSTWLPLAKSYPSKLGPHAQGTKVFFGHGSQDTLVRTSFGENSKNVVQGLGLDTEWKTFPMGHSACPEELQEVAAFLEKVVPDQ